jgi:hypothetical protein
MVVEFPVWFMARRKLRSRRRDGRSQPCALQDVGVFQALENQPMIFSKTWKNSVFSFQGLEKLNSKRKK